MAIEDIKNFLQKAFNKDSSSTKNIFTEQGFDMGNIRDRVPEKAHDNINELINNSEHKNLIQNLIVGGLTGPLGGSGMLIKKILSKIKARNARGIRNLRQGQGTGAQSMSSSNREFLNKEWDVWRKLKDLIK